MIHFPSLDEAVEIHRRVIQHFGGDEGVRDLGLLESALFRPQTGYYKDLAAMAAALMESLLINHPFVDGNKRVAFFLTDVFLRMNGFKLTGEPKPIAGFIEGWPSSKKQGFEELDSWIRKHLRSI